MKRLFIFLVLLSSAFAYTNGSGTIQDCKTNAYDYCTINISSVIQGVDFTLNTRETIIANGTSITLRNSRLFINSSERIWIKNNAWINGNGETASYDADGGSGGSFLITYTGAGEHGLSGNQYGNDGLGAEYPSGGPCMNPDPGEGAHVLPFDFESGTAGVGDTTSPEGATGGGFYATGGIYASSTSDCVRGSSGGSGHAIKLKSAKIQIDGKLTTDGGDGVTGTSATAAAAGSGAGEITLYSATTNITGSISAKGGNGDRTSSAGALYANGGAGGRFRSCALLNNYTTTITLTGGICTATGTTCSNGAAGTITYVSNSSCYQSMVLNLYTQNNTNITESNMLKFNLGVFNNTNVTCWYELNSTIYGLGQYNLTSEVTTYSFLPEANGTYEVNITCGNADGGIANITTSTVSLSFNSTVTPPAPPPPPPSGGGSGTSGGSYSPPSSTFNEPSTADEPETAPEDEEIYPDPNQNPQFYLNPPPTAGQGSIADSIVEASGGEIAQLPYECTPFFASAFNFVGSQFADSFVCEYKGLQSLYVKKFSFFINGALITLLMMSIMTVNQKKTGNYNLFLGLTVITAVIGFDFFAFMATALLLIIAGQSLGV